jgi:PTH1 family peptidyl-tRNA hydrolase
MRLIVGLGNPGLSYRQSRHNAGFRCVELMARMWGIPLSDRRAKAILGQGRRGGQDVVLAKPRTFMNHSGEGVAYLLTRFGARPSDLAVIYDDMSLPLGKLRIRPTGSDGGHNGIGSIIATLGTQAFPRIRVGIGLPPLGQDSVAFVLGRFTEAESTLISQSATLVAEAVACLLEENIDEAMNRFN